VQSLKEIVIDVPEQSAVSLGELTLLFLALSAHSFSLEFGCELNQNAFFHRSR